MGLDDILFFEIRVVAPDVRVGCKGTRDVQHVIGVGITTRTDEAHISVYSQSGNFDATRNPVNRKEWVLFKRPYRYIHKVWQVLGTFIIFALLTYVLTQDIGWFAVQMSDDSKTHWLGHVRHGLYTALLAGVLAYTVRWSVAAVTQRLWRVVDPSIEPSHFEQTVGSLYRKKVGDVLKYIGGLFVLLVTVMYGLAMLSIVGLELLT